MIQRIALALVLLGGAFAANAQLTPQEMIARMGRGINIGNTLEPPNEGGWNNPPVEEYYFDDYVSAGFSTVRIPITWHAHVATSSPFTIDTVWLNRVEQIVDWGLGRNLIIIINAHHEEWIKNDPSETNMERFDSIWSQIATRFREKSDSLLFEMINEPYPMPLEKVDELNARVLSIIRKNNPSRKVLFSGHMWSNTWQLADAAIPEDDYLIGYFHSYDPYLFGLEGEGIWGSVNDVNAVVANYQRATDWTNLTGIPTIIGEFGAVVDCDFNSRMYHYATYVEQALEHGIAFTVWDDGGWFRMYERQDHGWNELKDIVINFSAMNPTKLNVENLSGTGVLLQWINRVDDNDSIFIERGETPVTMTKIAALDPGVSVFTDTNVEVYNDYYYRVVAHYQDTTDLLSYPVTVFTDEESAMENPSSSGMIRVFPNPAESELFIRTIEGEIIRRVIIYDLGGRHIKSVGGGKSQMEISLEGLKKGIYLLEAETENLIYRSKFIRN
jgi:aryl-phospho-beta-D-glucosidase BglC (GH1 family)